MSETNTDQDQQHDTEHQDGDGVSELFDDVAPTEAPVKRQPRARRTATARSAVPLYSLAQVAQIMDFAGSYDDGTREERDLFLHVFGWESDPDGLRVAEVVNENPHEVEAFRTLQELIKTIWGPGLNWKEAIAFVGRIEQTESSVIAALVVGINGLNYDPDREAPITIKKNTPATDIFEVIVEELTSLKGELPDLPERIVWIDGLLAIWPGAE